MIVALPEADALHIYSRLVDLAQAQDKSEIWLWQAMAANHLLQNVYIDTNDWDNAELWYVRELWPLLARISHPDGFWAIAAATYCILKSPLFLSLMQTPDKYPASEKEAIIQAFQARALLLLDLLRNFQTEPS